MLIGETVILGRVDLDAACEPMGMIAHRPFNVPPLSSGRISKPGRDRVGESASGESLPEAATLLRAALRSRSALAHSRL